MTLKKMLNAAGLFIRKKKNIGGKSRVVTIGERVSSLNYSIITNGPITIEPGPVTAGLKR